MSQTPNTAIAVIGIDIGKDSFHVVGHDARGAMVLRQKWSWPSGSATRQYTALPDRLGSLRRRPSPKPRARIALALLLAVWAVLNQNADAGL